MRRCRPALGTFVEIEATAPRDDDLLRAAIERAYASIERVEAAMSFHRADSDVARLNRAGAGADLTLDPWTVDVLGLAIELHDATGGRFECAVGAELIGMGLLPGSAPATGSGSIGAVRIVDASRVELRGSICVDLGGIAKGAAVDRAVDALTAAGVTQATVNAGGDLRVLGPVPQPIHVRSTCRPPKWVRIGELADGAIATSSVAESGGIRDGRWVSALVDPRSRAPVSDRRSFSVLADRCAVADGLTKALAVDGHLSAACLERYGATALVL